MTRPRKFPLLQKVNEINQVPNIKNLPIYLEIGYSIFKMDFIEKSDEDRRWNFLMWTYEDETNEINKFVRQDTYVLNLFSMPHVINVSNQKKIKMHEYHYRYFRRHMESFKNWGFDSLEKNPEQYLQWFYQTNTASHIPYAKVTINYLDGK